MKKILLSLTSLLCITAVNAQDAHFTQYFASPSTLNPAQTGLTNSDWRASANFRNQWYSISNNPYVTASASFDMPILKGKLPEGDALGIGVSVLYDKAGTGALTNTSPALSIAYHKAFGSEKQHRMSFGIQGAYVSKSINFSKLIFEDEIDYSRSDAYLPNTTAEVFNADVAYPDFNAGLLYTGQLTEKASVYFGGSYFHITKPSENYSKTSNFSTAINNRISVYGGGSFMLNDKTVAYLSTMYQKQGPATEYLIGGAVGFILNPLHNEEIKNTIFYVGAWYRYGDAIAPYVGFEFSKMQIGFSYDVNMSEAQIATGGEGAFEFSLIYNGAITKNPVRKYNFACPKF